MIPDPSAQTPSRDGAGGPARDDSYAAPRAGHLCAACGQPIEASLWDMTIFASPESIAYLPCLWATNP